MEALPTSRERPRWASGAPALALSLSLGALCTSCAGPRLDAPDDAPRSVRIVSYNIKHGLGMDDRLDLARVAEVLRAEDPDVVLLQEVDERTARADGVDQAAHLGALLGMDHRFAPFMDFDGGRYGLALLSRLPVLADEVLVLPPGKQEPRAALLVTVDLAGRELRIANAHLDWLRDDSERVAQARALRQALLGRPGDVLLGGDLNDVAGSATLEVLSAGDGFVALGPGAPTFPSDEPVKGIDHFLLRAAAPGESSTSAALHVVDERVASDHRPVTLTLTFLP